MADIKNIDPASTVKATQTPRDRLQVKDRHFIPEPYKKVAEGMEKQFAQYMLEQMDNSIDRSESPSSSMEYYDSVMRDERSQMMAQNNELGLQKVILDQIYPERLRNQFAYQRYLSSRPTIKKDVPAMGQPTHQNVSESKLGNGGSK